MQRPDVGALPIAYEKQMDQPPQPPTVQFRITPSAAASAAAAQTRENVL